jgi:sulfur carrier protein
MRLSEKSKWIRQPLSFHISSKKYTRVRKRRMSINVGGFDMKVKINGKDVILEQVVTVQELLIQQKVEMPEYVTVVINEEIIKYNQFAIRKINAGDEIEVLYYMGGGNN